MNLSSQQLHKNLLEYKTCLAPITYFLLEVNVVNNDVHGQAGAAHQRSQDPSSVTC